jgi:hypothetical protein
LLKIGCIGSFCLERSVAGPGFFYFFPGFSGIFRDFPVAGPFYRVIVNWRRPGGLRWQRQKRKAESGKRKAESRKQKVESRKQKTESRKQKAESGKQKVESRNRRQIVS